MIYRDPTIRVSVWYANATASDEPDESWLAREVKTTPWGLYLAHSDYETYISASALLKVEITEVEYE